MTECSSDLIYGANERQRILQLYKSSNSSEKIAGTSSCLRSIMRLLQIWNKKKKSLYVRRGFCHRVKHSPK